MSVYLVGAGPGDPGLITAKGLELVRGCDVLVYDRLVAPEVVGEAPADALRIGREPLRQEAINELLVAYGRRGLTVVRLKGGDPFVFGRGGEEALALAEADVAFEVVPGVSSLSSVPAAAGIPVTHRGISSQITIAAGHDPEALDYAALAVAPGTLVLFMALAALPEIARRLIAHGRPPDTPAAVISSGTTEAQELAAAPLAEIAEAAAGLEPPALVVVGEVVALSERLRGQSLLLAH
jgi:uroporphyrin-III C-methyltransferase